MTDTQIAAPNDVEALLYAVAAHGLEHSALALPPRLDPGPTWDRLLAKVGSKRLSGHLVDAITSGALEVTGRQAHAAAEQHASFMASSLWLEQMLLEVIDLFDDEGIAHRVLKGCAVAHLDYDDPSLRCFGDVDLLVRPEQIDRAFQLLTAAGYRRRYPEPRPGFDRRFSKGAAFVSPSGLELDVHRTLALGRFGLMIDLGDLWSEPQPYELGGCTLRAMGPQQRFLHACYHAALGDPTPRLPALRDMAQHLGPGRDPLHTTAVLGTTARWGGEAVLSRGLNLATTILGLRPTELTRWSQGYVPSRRDRRALMTYTDPSLGSAARSLAAATSVPGLWSKVVYLRALAFPNQHGARQARAARWRRWMSGVRQSLRLRRAP